MKNYLNPWVVTVFASISSGIAASYVQTGHLLVEEIRQTFKVNYKDASLIPSISLALLYLSWFCLFYWFFTIFRSFFLLF